MTLISHILTKSCHTPFVTLVIHLTTGDLAELVTLLVNAVVGQVHELILDVAFLVRLCAKSSQTLLEDIYSEWIVTCDSHIYT